MVRSADKFKRSFRAEHTGMPERSLPRGPSPMPAQNAYHAYPRTTIRRTDMGSLHCSHQEQFELRLAPPRACRSL